VSFIVAAQHKFSWLAAQYTKVPSTLTIFLKYRIPIPTDLVPE